ncbi:MAG: hypothetical protein JSS03_00650 [Proteobacteria bacterium]|nr:hypothetical protein [Pseudomonadota bacterium]
MDCGDDVADGGGIEGRHADGRKAIVDDGRMVASVVRQIVMKRGNKTALKPLCQQMPGAFVHAEKPSKSVVPNSVG